MSGALLLLIGSATSGGGGPDPDALEVTASAPNWAFNGFNFYSPVNAFPTGGTPPYSYVWNLLSGPGAYINSSLDDFCLVNSNYGDTATISCTVTDAAAVVAVSNIVTITL